MEIRNIVTTFFQDYSLDVERGFLVGFSGGPDSLCILSLLVEGGIPVIAAHLDHGLRPSSAIEAEKAYRTCSEMGVRCIHKREDVAEFALKNHLSIEEAARNMRYEFLFETALQVGAQAVVVAHNADDQVETILMHLLRGSAVSGLAGMRSFLLPNPWSEKVPLLRPLLQVNRRSIEEYLSERGLVAVIDESNTNLLFFRNRIRHELIPILETYNPQIKQRLLNMAMVIAAEDDWLDDLVKKAWRLTVIQEGQKYLVMDRSALLDQDPAVLRRLMRQAIGWMDNTLRDIDFDVVTRAAQFCKKSTRSNRVDLIAGLELFYYGKDRLVLAYTSDQLNDLWPQFTQPGEMKVPTPGFTRVNDRWSLSASKQHHFQPTVDPFVAQIDAKKLTGDLVLCSVKPGDRFKPYGYAGNIKKVGDFWTGEGLPARARKHWPLIQSGGEIIWIPGFRISDKVVVDETTQDIIRLELVKE